MRRASPESWPRLTGVGVVFPGGLNSGAGQSRWVLARSLCRFRHFRLPPEAGAQRRTVLRNLLRAWAPFDDTAYCVVARSDAGFAWAWDRPRVAALLATASAPAGAALIPEALLAPRETTDGVRLLQTLEGVDAQVWKGGELLASRWWPQAPEPEDWARWWRSTAVDSGLGADPPLPLPSVQTPVWRQAWAEGVALDDLLSSSSRIERIALGAAVVGLLGLTSAQLHLAWQALDERGRLSDERDRLTALAGPVVGARDRALALVGEAAALSGQLAAPLPLEVLQHLAERLPSNGVTLRELELTGTRLRIALDAPPALPRATMVKDLQAAGWFVQVNEIRDVSGRGWIGFEMQIQGLRPPLTDPAAMSGAKASPAPDPGLPMPGGAAVRPAPSAGLVFPLPTVPPPGAPGARP